MNNIQVLLRAVMLAGLLLFLVSCTQASPPQTSVTPTVNRSTPTVLTTPQPTATATPTPPRLGAVPQDCPPGPTPQYVNAAVGPGVGAPPVWAVGFDGPHATLHIGNPQDNMYTQYGWERKVLWVVSDSSPSPVTLHGGSLADGTPLWFQIGDQAPAASPVLRPEIPDPELLTVTSYPWTDFPSYLLIPKAGCYYLEAQWAGGSWRITLAAGL